MLLKSIISWKNHKKNNYHDTPDTARHGEGKSIVVREIFAIDVEGIESVGAVGAVFEQVFFTLGKFLAGLVFAEAVASATDPCRLNGENQVLVVWAVEKRHKALLTCEALIYEQVFFIVSHRVSEVHGFATMPCMCVRQISRPCLNRILSFTISMRFHEKVTLDMLMILFRYDNRSAKRKDSRFSEYVIMAALVSIIDYLHFLMQR